jgi:hypothetical protein
LNYHIYSKGITSNDDPGKEMTVREVFITAVNNNLPGEAMTAEDKNKAFNLSLKLFASKEVNITVTEAAMFKERVGKIYNPLVYGRICHLLDGESSEIEKEE